MFFEVSWDKIFGIRKGILAKKPYDNVASMIYFIATWEPNGLVKYTVETNIKYPIRTIKAHKRKAKVNIGWFAPSSIECILIIDKSFFFGSFVPIMEIRTIESITLAWNPPKIKT
jgi:hypothetical protein